MPADRDSIDRMAPTRRPERSRLAGFQTWSDLLFVHWRIPAEDIRPLIPPDLTIDTFDGSAWIGLIPFHMSGVRMRWFPPIPGASEFHETNVRTYVHFRGRDPGVWFFSLEAASSLAVRVARWTFGLPYFRADMEIERTGEIFRYSSRRRSPVLPAATTTIQAERGGPLNADGSVHRSGQAEPGTLEHFLAERYILYSQPPRRPLKRGRVHHAPYPLRSACLRELNETLLMANHLTPPAEPEHVMFSDGVDVEIFGLEPVVEESRGRSTTSDSLDR